MNLLEIYRVVGLLLSQKVGETPVVVHVPEPDGTRSPREIERVVCLVDAPSGDDFVAIQCAKEEAT